METVSFSYMAASAGLSGMLAEAITLPIDTAKVRMQLLSKSNRTGVKPIRIGFIPVLRHMFYDEGITSWWKGLPAGLHRQMIYATLRISMYPHIRDFVRRQKSLKYCPDLGIKVIAGMTAGAIGMTVANPTDVVKVRLQSAITASIQQEGQANFYNNLPKKNKKYTTYKGALHAYKSIISEEGALGLWRGLGPNIIRNMIVCAAEMVAYDEIKRIAMQFLPDGLLCHCTAGFGAGFMATVLGSPVDVVKTRYMNARPGEYSGIGHCLIHLQREAGFRGFYKGFVPNMVRMGTFNLLVFVLYEQILKQIRDMNQDICLCKKK